MYIYTYIYIYIDICIYITIYYTLKTCGKPKHWTAWGLRVSLPAFLMATQWWSNMAVQSPQFWGDFPASHVWGYRRIFTYLESWVSHEYSTSPLYPCVGEAQISDLDHFESTCFMGFFPYVIPTCLVPHLSPLRVSGAMWPWRTCGLAIYAGVGLVRQDWHLGGLWCTHNIT